MDSIMLDRAYAALMSGVEESGWEQIEPTRRYIPLAIQRKEAELDEAQASLDGAIDLHEQADTEATEAAVIEWNEKVKAIGRDLEEMRGVYLAHPDAFEEEGTGVS
mgnify:CR=1 FL=1